MDTLDISITHEEDILINHDESTVSNGSIAVMIKVIINGKEMPGILNIDNFFESIRKRGMHPLFTCTCGTFECGGYYIFVDYSKSIMVLKNSYGPTNNPAESKKIDTFEYHIPWEDVIKAGCKIIQFLLEIHNKRHNYRIYSGTFGVDISYWIPEYISLWQKYFPGSIAKDLTNQLVVDKDMSYTAKLAIDKWKVIPEDIRVKIKNDVWCDSCRELVKIVDYNVRLLDTDLFLYGKCGICGRRTVRVATVNEVPLVRE